MEKNLSKTYKKEHKKLLGFIYSKINKLQDAEDILQEVFLQASKNMNSLQTIDNLIGWLYFVAKNKIIDWYRKKKIDSISLHAEVNHNLTFEGIIKDCGIDIEKEYIRKIVMDEIINEIDNLPEDQKNILIEQVIEDKTFKEISNETGIPINTLIARKRYALITLRKKLDDMKEIINEFK